MSGVFIIRNQLGHYWGKSGSWVKGDRVGQVACWTHKDEAVNTLFEIGSQDTDLRGEVMLTETEEQPPIWKSANTPCPKPTRATTLKIMQKTPLMNEHAVFFLERTR